MESAVNEDRADAMEVPSNEIFTSQDVDAAGPDANGLDKSSPEETNDQDGNVPKEQAVKNTRETMPSTTTDLLSNQRSVRFAGVHSGDAEEPKTEPQSASLKLDISTASSSSNPVLQQRVGSHMDLVTGAKTRRCQSIQVLPRHNANEQPSYNNQHQQNVVIPISPRLRSSILGTSAHNSLVMNSSSPSELQYRISSKQIKKNAHSNAFDAIVIDDAISTLNTIASMQRVGQLVTQYLFWTFRTSFFHVTMASMTFFMLLITLFAVGIYGIGQVQPECVVGVEVGNGTIAFGDAYHLSWTTLSTVGYGVMAPGLPSTTLEVDENGNESFHRCTGINILMALESFVGVLFGGVTGAIIFAKVARIQSIATVVFSDPILIRYGKGLLHNNKSNTGDDSVRPSTHLKALTTEEDDDEVNDHEIPCPILEFRMINTSWNQKGGEIMDSQVNLVAARLETKKEVEERISGFKPRRKKRRKKGARRRAAPKKRHHNQHHSNHPPPSSELDSTTDTKDNTRDGHEPASDLSGTLGSEDDDAKLLREETSMLHEQDENHEDEEIDDDHVDDDHLVTPSSSGLSSPSASEHSEEMPESASKVSLVGSEISRSTSIASGSFLQRVNQSFISSSISEAMRASNNLIVVETEDGKDMEPYNRQELERQQTEILHVAVEKEVEHRMSVIQKEAAAAIATRGTMAVDEGNSAFVPRRIFYSMEVETDSHPFFRRTWNIRHVCNENSPLLSHSVRQRIEECDGYWPPELNSHDAVRKAINFHEIIVSFSGTQNVSASSMYAVKIYKYVDMAVGYAFANVLAKNDDEHFIVDESLLNDVTPQVGGGEEPIDHKDDPQFVGYSTTNNLSIGTSMANSVATNLGISPSASLSTDGEREEKKVDELV